MASKSKDDAPKKQTKGSAALDHARLIMQKHRLVVVDCDDIDKQDQNLVYMNEKTMEGLAMPVIDEETGLVLEDEDPVIFFDQDYCELIGRVKMQCIAVMMTDEDLADGEISMSRRLRDNLKVKPSDQITVHGISDNVKAQTVTIQPIEESMVGIRSGGDSGLRSVFIDPHFNDFKEQWDANRPVWKGQIITCLGGGGMEVMFKVAEVSANSHYIQLGDLGTDITIGPPISDDEALKEFNKVGYSDVGGLRQQLAKIREIVELPIRHPGLFAKIGVRAPKGVLMHGPPGCGKSLIARAISNETGANFIIINGPEIISPQSGGSEQNIKEIFAKAAEKAPTILFIDEIDAIAPNRDQVNDEAMQRVVATLLTCMDGLEASAHIMVIGATNRPNSIDPALRRSGRFDTELVIPVPSREARLEILKIVTRKQKLAPDVDLEILAEDTTGYVGADLTNLCTKAAVGCIRRCAKGIIDMDEDDIPPEFLAALRVDMADYLGAMKVTGPSLTRDVVVETPNVSFDDIGGLDAVKQELREMVAMPYLHGDFFEDLNILPPKGALMYGPPGCGKTLIAKAMARECKANFISVKGPQLLSKWIGESESNVREYFQKARQSAPCILFFDELDSIASKRGQSSGNLTDKVVNQLLTEMDGMGERGNVFVIGATNRPDNMDDAILRTGRLDQMIYIPMPEEVGRKAIFKAVLRKATVSNRLDYDKMAAATDKYSGADIAGICAMATKIDMRKRIELILKKQKELIEAAEKEGTPLDPKKALAEAKKGYVGKNKDGSGKWKMSVDCFEIAFKNTARSISDADLKMYSAHAKQLAQQTGSSSTLTTSMDFVGIPDLLKKSAEADGDDEDEDMYA